MANQPNKDIWCHRTGFKKRCFDMVTNRGCQLWVHVQGTDPQTEQIVSHGACADSWMPKLTIEVAQMVRQNTASTDKVATVVQKHADESVAIGAMAVQRARDAVASMLSEQQMLPNFPSMKALPKGNGDADKLD